MILSDRDIRSYLKDGKLVIEDLEDKDIKAGCVDLTLGDEFRVFKTSSHPYIDLKKPENNTESVMIHEDRPFIIHPHEFVLGQVKEKIEIPADLAAYVDGRSSLGRLGLVVHVTSGFVDPGFRGRLVLEMTNVGRMPIALHKNMKVCKLVLFKLSSEAEKPYFMREDAKYKSQDNVVSSKVHKDFDNK